MRRLLEGALRALKGLCPVLIGIACTVAVWYALLYGLNMGMLLWPGPRLQYIGLAVGGVRG